MNLKKYCFLKIFPLYKCPRQYHYKEGYESLLIQKWVVALLSLGTSDQDKKKPFGQIQSLIYYPQLI